MKKIIALSIAAIIIISVAGMGTYAFFSDTQKSTGNQIQAGTLYLSGGNTAFFTSTLASKALPSSGGQDETTTLTPAGSVTTGNYLSIKLTNVQNIITGFPSSPIHDINGNVISAGDLGLGSQLAIWVTTHASESAPIAGDIQLNVPTTGNHLGTLTTLPASPTLTYSNWGVTLGKAGTYAPTDWAAWNNIYPSGLGTGPVYFHITWKIPESNDSTTNNPLQGLKISSDFYFTLATIGTPYTGP